MRDRVRGWLRSIANRIKRTGPTSWLSRQWQEHPARLVAYILLFVSFLAFLANFLPYKLAQDFAANFATEFFSLALTVIIIDRLYEGIQDRQLKEQLILQMGSRHNDVTDTAVRTLRARGWLTDGSLQNADLYQANLQEANLRGANLKETNLSQANLERANLMGVNLQKAKLIGANLQNAILSGTNLQEAQLISANLQSAELFRAELQKANLSMAKLEGASLMGANLQGAKVSTRQLKVVRSAEGAVMPDGEEE